MSAMFKKADVKRRADLVVWWGKTMQGKSAKTDASSTQFVATPDDIQSTDRSSASLTAEETAVMDLLYRGMTTEEIISLTQSSKRKVDKKLRILFNKTQTKNRTELVRWWRENGTVK